jgi:hypothetical protein
MELFYTAVIVACFVVLSLLFFWLAMMMENSTHVYNSEAGDCPNGYMIKPGSTTLLDGTSSYSCIIPESHKSYYTTSGQGAFRFNESNSTAILGYSSADDDGDTTINFSNSMWLGKTGRCNKHQWAMQNNSNAVIHWDGITNSQANAC